jgi:hypothetical protein
MPAAGDLARPEVRGAACLNADNTGRQSGKEARDLAPAQSSAQNDFPASVNPVSWKTCFAISMPMVLTSSMDAPVLVIFDDHQFGTQLP